MNILNLWDLKSKTITELIAFAQSLNIDDDIVDARKQDVILSILKHHSQNDSPILARGILEILPDGFGFLRSETSNYLPSPDDIYVHTMHIRKYHLKTGDTIEGHIRIPQDPERYISLVAPTQICFQPVNLKQHRVHFDNLTPLYPSRQINLNLKTIKQNDLTLRVINLISVLGFGQRALIVAPPRTGKTVMMQNIAHAISSNHPNAHLIVLLVDERPEEVTDMQRSVRGDVISSTFDEPAENHVRVAEMVLAKAKRLVETGKDVVILLDNITRLARAYNTVAPSSGKILSGGIDANAMQRPKRFFGAARNIEEGGSLTIIATALVETGSRMDEVIFEEFKGTGNAEIVLDRKLSDKRTFPAIDITKSGTRKEELLVPRDILSKMWVLRRVITPMGSNEGMDFLLEKLAHTKDNDDFFSAMNS